MNFSHRRRTRSTGIGWRLLLAATAALGLGGGLARATDYTGSFLPGGSFSTNNLAPTPVTFTLGENVVTGTTGGFVSNYMAFTLGADETLSAIVLLDSSTAPDRTFFGIASGASVVVDPSFTSAKGLLGWTLMSDAMDGENVLPALAASAPADFPAVPGASGFTPPLGAGTYSTWIVDGDGEAGAVPYKMDFVVSSAPEPSTWALLALAVGAVGTMLRRTARRHPRAAPAA